MSAYGPHVLHRTLKDGREKFEFRVNPTHRPAGWPPAILLYEQTVPAPLSDEVLAFVRDRSIALHQELASRRIAGVNGRKPAPVPENEWSSMGDKLLRSYWGEGLSLATRSRYRSMFNTIARDFHDRPDYAIATLTVGAIEAWARARGFSYHTVISMQGAVNRLRERATAEGLLPQVQPIRLKVKKPLPAPVILWTSDDVQALTTLFDQRGDPDMATLIFLGFETGQRLGDLRQLRYGVDYEDGGLHFLTNKTGARVLLKLPPYLVARLEARRRDGGLLILSKRGKPHTASNLGNYFANTLQWSGWDGPKLKLRHLRHTAVVNFARAGCTVPQIASVTRHAMRTVNQIMAHYLPHDPVLAEQAMTMRASVAVEQRPQTLMIEGSPRVFTGDLALPAKPNAGRRRRSA